MRSLIAGKRGQRPRRWLAMLVLLCSIPASLVARSASASFAGSASGSSGGVSVSFFYSDLQPYGRWIDNPTYGYCWVPGSVVPGWRPYWHGHWIYTDFGWTWVSDEPWGWATYHYGRWFDDPGYGWVWVPGTVWGPAWVDWRWSDECVGWAPLPPGASWGVWGGLSFSDPARIPVGGWSFVEPRSFVDVDLRSRTFPVAQNELRFSRTRDVTRIAVNDGRPVNVGVSVHAVEQHAGRPVDRIKVVDASPASRGRGRLPSHGEIAFYRPEVHRSPGSMPEVQRQAGPSHVAQRWQPQAAPHEQRWQPQGGPHEQRWQPQAAPHEQRWQPRAAPHEQRWQPQAEPRASGFEHGPPRPASQPHPEQREARQQAAPNGVEHPPYAGRQNGHDHGRDKGRGKQEHG